MKKLILFLMLFVTACIDSMAAYNSFRVGDALYRVRWEDENTVVAIMVATDKHDITSFSIPETVDYEGQPRSVAVIYDTFFEDCSQLESVTFPSTMIDIPGGLFNSCPNLKTISVAVGNTKYDGREGCNAIIATSSNTLVAGCQNSVIPNTVTSIGNNAFNNCSGLTSITIPNSVVTIGEYAFFGCKGLTSVEIPNSVTSIKSRAFASCSNLTSITIPNSVTSINEAAFQGCSKLSSITIPNSVTSLGSFVFSGCSGLTSIEIPNSLTNIPDGTFRRCGNLASIIIPNSVTSIGARAFEDSGFISLEIPNSVTSIGAYAFSGTSLASITLPNSITSIDDYMFYGCGNLNSITIPNSVTKIGVYVFCCCSNLASIEIPNSVTEIGEHAFDRCSNLASIEIPNSVTKIGDFAFQQCFKLKHIIVSYKEFENVFSKDWLTWSASDGIIEGPCELEDYKDKLYLPDSWTAKPNHSLQNTPVVAETCTTDGNIEYWTCELCHRHYSDAECQNCIEEKSWVIPALGHSCALIKEALAETCTTDGNDAYYTCQRCHIYSSDAEGKTEIVENSWIRPALGHDWEDIYDEPNYTWTHHCKNDAAHDMHRKQLCFEARLDNSNIRWSQNSENKFLQYSINWSDEWTELTNVGVTLNKGDKVWIKGSTPEAYSHGRFNIYNGSFDASGSIMSLLDGEGTSTVIPYEDCFKQMFTYCDDLYKAPALPATTLTSGCYAEMFSYCKDLKSAPALPATTLATGSYKEMFRGCNNLSNVPALPAETLVENCYYYMFQGCQKLESLTINATDVSATNCLKWCLDGTSLYSSKPVLHITDELALQNVDLGLPTKWRVDKVGIHANQDPDNAGDYYATFFDSQSEYSVKEGTKAYTGIVDGSVLNMTAEADNIIPAGEGVLLKGNTANVILTLSDTGKVQTAGNALRGSDTNTTAPANCYILSYGQNKLGFYKYAAGDALAAHKAYLVCDNAGGAKGFSIVFNEDIPTGLGQIENGEWRIENSQPTDIYNLQGIRLNNLHKGINIVNGKKIWRR